MSLRQMSYHQILVESMNKNWNETNTIRVSSLHTAVLLLTQAFTKHNHQSEFTWTWLYEFEFVLTSRGELSFDNQQQFAMHCSQLDIIGVQLQSQLLWYPQSATPMGVSMVPKQGYMPHYACFHGQMVHNGQLFWKIHIVWSPNGPMTMQACWHSPTTFTHAVRASDLTHEGTLGSPKWSEDGGGFCRAERGEAWVWQSVFFFGLLWVSTVPSLSLAGIWWHSKGDTRLQNSCAGKYWLWVHSIRY